MGEIGPCLCGDPECPSCGSAQGYGPDSGPKYPGIHVQLTGEDGNAFGILGRVCDALRRGRVDRVEIEQFKQEALSGNYDNLLQTCMRWVSVA